MKKIILISVLVFYGITSTSCSFSDDFDIPQKKSLNNVDFIKNQLMGQWKYWGRFSIDRNQWVPNLDAYSIYDFKANDIFTFHDKKSGKVIDGLFKIIPATNKLNPYIELSYTDNGMKINKRVLLLTFNNNFMSIFETPFEERYQKQ
ncbi:hypothetical protein CEY12_05970 [Chryseobacterium sp. T16E-39]|uniref:hypothetical protein n=1 Tax=Chryseobacterium sp. T16E-39 TaxID=2015076 RepID=UPI000B5B1E34|nr:hypothetical protein [Chryseobacterium sp. T16E-39]ASK29677.1 hypothetical protein CEY12_05970 [Chryseobacterium sp. T16E-39]